MDTIDFNIVRASLWDLTYLFANDVAPISFVTLITNRLPFYPFYNIL